MSWLEAGGPSKRLRLNGSMPSPIVQADTALHYVWYGSAKRIQPLWQFSNQIDLRF
jgi:hypothetical protein